MKKLCIKIGAEIEIPDNFDLTDTKSGKIEDLLYDKVKSGDYKLCGETYIHSLLTERVQGEFENFRRGMITNFSSTEVFDKSYEICWKTEIYQAVVDTEYTEEQEIGLLNCRGSLLNILYEEWMHYSYDSVDELRQMIERFADKLYEEER